MKVFEKVNPMHPDKIADRIAGAIVDLGYEKNDNPKIAVEVLIGHGEAFVIIESSEDYSYEEVNKIVNRIGGDVKLKLIVAKQDPILLNNQNGKIKCGDNGIFKGVPLTVIERHLSNIARQIYAKFNYDGKYIISQDELIICQSNAYNTEIKNEIETYRKLIINPLGYWTGGTNVDTGATNRKLGSDMAQSITGGGLHGKDLSKADVSINIYAFLKAQETKRVVELYCTIGDEFVDGRPYEEIVDIAQNFINDLGGFEKLAEWGLF